jgi:PKD repeat protein
VAPDEDVTFDASASRDPDGGIVAYEWDFGDGNKGNGVLARHRYRAPGTYKVKLTVRDDAGLANSTATSELTVRVNAPPAPIISGPDAVCLDQRVAWRSDQSRDPDGPISAFRWTMGDGTSFATAEASHAYKKHGMFSLALFADDGTKLKNAVGQITRAVKVNQPPIAVAGFPQLACPGEAVEFDGFKSSDPDGKIVRYVWDFGDGTTAEGVKPRHAFEKPGTYKVKLTVTDDSASICSAATDVVEVTVNAPPVAIAGPDREVWIGGAADAVLLDATASHHQNGLALTFAWQIGNSDAKLGERVRHTFTAPGVYPVTLTVTDSTGLSCGTATTTFRIIARQRN